MHQLFIPVHFLFWQPGRVGGQYTTVEQTIQNPIIFLHDPCWMRACVIIDNHNVSSIIVCRAFSKKIFELIFPIKFQQIVHWDLLRSSANSWVSLCGLYSSNFPYLVIVFFFNSWTFVQSNYKQCPILKGSDINFSRKKKIPHLSAGKRFLFFRRCENKIWRIKNTLICKENQLISIF